MKFHSTLNPKLWDENNNLDEEVRDHLLDIADAFIEYLEIPEEAVKDILIVGSSANYNWNKYSDLDVHIKVDYDEIEEDCPLVGNYLWALKSLFNSQHDISIHKIPVELYAESTDEDANSNGVFSLKDNKWLKQPEPIPPTDNDSAVNAKVEEIKEAVKNCDNAKTAEEILDKIYKMRQAGLDSDEAELSTENLAFKKLRNDGILDNLKKIKVDDFDKSVSLENLLMDSPSDIDRLYINLFGDDAEPLISTEEF